MDLRVESPFPAWAWPLVWQWMQSFRGRVCDDFSPVTCDAFVAQMQHANPAETWAVYRGEDLGGLIWVHRLSPVLAFSHMVFSRAFWGRETTETAVRTVFDQVFTAGVEKIASQAFADNHQVRALGRAIGGVEEGRRRKHTRRSGVPVDLIDFGLLKEDFYANWNTSSHADNGRADSGIVGRDRPAGSRQDGHIAADMDA